MGEDAAGPCWLARRCLPRCPNSWDAGLVTVADTAHPLHVEVPLACRHQRPGRRGSCACSTLRQAGTPHTALHERVDLSLTQHLRLLANTKPDGAERAEELGRTPADYAMFGKRPGFAGAFARLRALELTKTDGSADELEAAFAAHRDRDLLDLGLSFPEAMAALGLLVESDAGVQGPRSSSLSHPLERSTPVPPATGSSPSPQGRAQTSPSQKDKMTISCPFGKDK